MALLALRSALTRTTLLLGASAMIAFAAGCGGDDDASTGGGGESGGNTSQITATAGKDVFAAAGCNSCHTLADAGAQGNIGPNLDEDKPSKDRVASVVTDGDGRMPSFKDRLTAEQIDAVADYVSSVAGQ